MLRFEGLSVRFRDVLAVDDVTLDIADGEFVVLIGPSGAGKSTLLRCINGLQTPTSGRLEVAGIGEARGRKRLLEIRRQTGFIFQLHQLVLRMTALSNVLTGRLGYHHQLRGVLPPPRSDLRIALRSLERVGLLDRARKRCDQLSGGERQRVGIARAVAQEPRLILADEPVASLDPVTSEKVLRLIKGICVDDGLTAVVCLHQVDLARMFGERVIGMRAGRIVFDGPPEALDDAALAAIYGTEVTGDDTAHRAGRRAAVS